MDVTLGNWGSDESGLIVGYVFEAGCAPVPIDAKAAEPLIHGIHATRSSTAPERFL